jgi:vacuole membrane protein 1
LAGKKSEELDEMIDENNVNRKDLSGLPLIERLKVLIYKTL